MSHSLPFPIAITFTLILWVVPSSVQSSSTLIHQRLQRFLHRSLWHEAGFVSGMHIRRWLSIFSSVQAWHYITPTLGAMSKCCQYLPTQQVMHYHQAGTLYIATSCSTFRQIETLGSIHVLLLHGIFMLFCVKSWQCPDPSGWLQAVTLARTC